MTAPENAAELLGLAERCEAATGPELDGLIRAACFAPSGAVVEQSPINGAWCAYVETGGRKRLFSYYHVSHEQRNGEFTASLDAAMTLVPEGWRMLLDNDGCHCRLMRSGKADCTGFAGSMAQAVTAAALRARAAGGEK